jgi:hypothetical protein
MELTRPDTADAGRLPRRLADDVEPVTPRTGWSALMAPTTPGTAGMAAAGLTAWVTAGDAERGLGDAAAASAVPAASMLVAKTADEAIPPRTIRRMYTTHSIRILIGH